MRAREAGKRICALLLALGPAWSPRPALAAQARPLLAVLGICSTLASDTYPEDTQNWFNPTRDSQVVFYAQLLFPVDPLPDELSSWAPCGPWHPPMAVLAPSRAAEGAHYAQAQWLDPQGKSIALFGRTLTARARDDWILVDGRAYVPQTFAMAIGTRDLRASAGQTRLPSLKGEYTVGLTVDGRALGLAFFRMLQAESPTVVPGAGAQVSATAPTPRPAAAAVPTPVTVPTLPPLQLP